MLALMKLLPLIPIAQTLFWAMLAIALWLGRDLIVTQRRFGPGRAAQPARVPAFAVRRLRWKLAVLSGLAATELVLCLVGVSAL